MKTSIIEVRDMLSVLSVVGVEKQIGEVPGVKSVTVNFAAGNAAVRYDETRLNVADIKSAVRQRANPSQRTQANTNPYANMLSRPPHKRCRVPLQRLTPPCRKRSWSCLRR